MKKEDVPQQGGLNAGEREVSYAVDNDGHYTLEKSVGWEAKNIALSQAWEEIGDQLRDMLDEVKAGKKSALAYHMVKNQMDLGLLCQYSGVAKWRVKRHLKPGVFAKLTDAVLAPYADLFGMSVEALRFVPDEVPSPEFNQTEVDNS
jgi:hypothetical protein